MHIENPIFCQSKSEVRLRDLIQGLWTIMMNLYGSLRTRRQLATLEPRELRDIGVTEAERRRECARPFWD